ncbi:hypothetical protein A8F94_05730 [Bacillus sp. FJAT-27225]|nr:hypothetical protein A8F94_05730 [Bacillus sp. FJAT-27225]
MRKTLLKKFLFKRASILQSEALIKKVILQATTTALSKYTLMTTDKYHSLVRKKSGDFPRIFMFIVMRGRS